MAAFIAAQNLDVMSYNWLKIKVPKHLWLRNNGSTWTSQLVDTVIFCTLAFAGIYEMKVVLGIILSTYILKIVVAAIDTPFLYFTKLIVRIRPKILG
jgi:uncharacterized integral membrane protein (TIGR00697 family)